MVICGLNKINMNPFAKNKGSEVIGSLRRWLLP